MRASSKRFIRIVATVLTLVNLLALSWLPVGSAAGESFSGGLFRQAVVVSHTYPATGVYTALVTASDSVSELTATTVITITDVPIAGLTATNDCPTMLGGVTTLSATVESGSNVSYAWKLE
jgi:hypothetical protein